MVYKYQPGDILAAYGTSFQERFIRGITFSPFGQRRLKLGPSHVMIVFPYKGELICVESTSKCTHACMMQGRIRPGVQLHPIHRRVKDYDLVDGWVDIYRLSPVWKLDALSIKIMTDIIDDYVGREVGYDMGGALLSGTPGLRLTDFMPGVDHNEMFCSQLVAAILQRLGRMNVDNARKYHPSKLLRQLIKTGVYQYERQAPLDDPPPPPPKRKGRRKKPS